MSGAQTLTHTPEQLVQWREIAVSNPGRLVRTLTLGPGRTTQKGDTQGDIFPALEVVCEISKMGRGDEESATWVALVNAGIDEALCKNVCEMVTFLNTLPNMPKEILEAVKKELPSPYYRPLEVLCNAACCFKDSPTSTDRKVINTLRKNWAIMMERVWREPENTLESHDSHIRERMVIPQLVIRLIITDPSFVSTLYDPSDLTIQIIARHWKYSTHTVDAQLTISVLSGLLNPDHPGHVAYVRTNNLESSVATLIGKIYNGVSPPKTATKPKQAKSLLAAMTDHLLRATSKGDGRLAITQFQFLSLLTTVAGKDGTEPEFSRCVLGYAPLWNAIFRLLKKCAKPFSGSKESEVEKGLRLTVIQSIVGVAASALHGATFENPTLCEPFIRIWANEGFFGALEETVEIIVQITGMPMQLTRIGAILENVLSMATPPTLQLYCDQFPRWRILGVLIQHDIDLQAASGHPPQVVTGVIEPRDSTAWDHMAWQVWGKVHYLCFDPEIRCARRGCGKSLIRKSDETVVECTCASARWCAESCRDKDLKDHTRVCTQMVALDAICKGNRSAQAKMTQPQVQETMFMLPMPAVGELGKAGLEDLD